MGSAEIVDVAQLVGGKPDGVHHKHIAIFIMADGFAKPGWFDPRRVFTGKEDAADHVIALPDHPHLVRHLDEIERLESVYEVAGNANAPSARFGDEGQLPHDPYKFSGCLPYNG